MRAAYFAHLKSLLTKVRGLLILVSLRSGSIIADDDAGPETIGQKIGQN